MGIPVFLKNAYSFKYNAYSMFLYALTFLIVVEVYLLGIRGKYMGVLVMITAAAVTSFFTKNMLMILTNALVIPAMGVIVMSSLR